MAHAWKACWVNALGGSNPPSSALVTSANGKPSAQGQATDRAPVSFVILDRLLDVPEQTADLVRDLPPDRVRDVLTTRRHRGARPTHDAHHGALGDAENQEHRRRRVPGVVKPAVADPGLLQQCLPAVVIRTRVQRRTDHGGEDPIVVLPELTGRSSPPFTARCDARATGRQVPPATQPPSGRRQTSYPLRPDWSVSAADTSRPPFRRSRRSRVHSSACVVSREFARTRLPGQRRTRSHRAPHLAVSPAPQRSPNGHHLDDNLLPSESRALIYVVAGGQLLQEMHLV